jgi:hypothetical protein
MVTFGNTIIWKTMMDIWSIILQYNLKKYTGGLGGGCNWFMKALLNFQVLFTIPPWFSLFCDMIKNSYYKYHHT